MDNRNFQTAFVFVVTVCQREITDLFDQEPLGHSSQLRVFLVEL